MALFLDWPGAVAAPVGPPPAVVLRKFLAGLDLQDDAIPLCVELAQAPSVMRILARSNPLDSRTAIEPGERPAVSSPARECELQRHAWLEGFRAVRMSVYTQNRRPPALSFERAARI